jgi:hypothetical protein
MSRSSIVNFIAAATGRPQLRLSDAKGIAVRQADQLAKNSAAHDGHAMPLESASRLADRLRHAAEEQKAIGAERKPHAECRPCYVVTAALELDALGLANQYNSLPVLANSDCNHVGCAHPTRFVSGKAAKSVGRDWGLSLSQQACMKESSGLNDPQLRFLLQRLLAVLADIREHQVRSQARFVALRPPQFAPVAEASPEAADFSLPKLAGRRRIGGFLTGIGLSGLFGALLYLLTI